MKEYYLTQKVTYNLMSFTSFKSLLIFSLLTEGPKSFDEIIYHVNNNKILPEKISKDTVRVYINSLKIVGCNIKRIKDKNRVSKYVISEHPFELKLSEDQIKSIYKVYKILVKNMDIQDLLYMDNLFNKIGKYIKNENFINTFKSLSPLKNTDTKLLQELLECCKNKYQILVEYKSPNSNIKDIEIITDKIDFRNNKLYLLGFGLEYKENGIFPISRIKKIKEVKTSQNNHALNKTKVIYEIDNSNRSFELKENEAIINKNDNIYTVEANVTNMFLFRQRLLEFGPSCKILEPEHFKQEFVELLKNMKEGYYYD